MGIHVIDDEELDARMTKVVNNLLDIFYKEKFTAKDVLWLLEVLRWRIEDEYREQKEKMN